MKKVRIILSIILLVSIFIAPGVPSMAAGSTQEKVIILFKDSINQDLIEKVQGTVQFQYDSIHAVSMTVPTEAISILKNDASVLSVQEDQPVQIESQIVDWGNVDTKVEESKQAGFTGKGVKIAILDTGVDTQHPDLKISGGTCLLESCPNSYHDDNGHGTHVAGIIGAQNNNIGVVGVAPDANIYAIKVLDRDGFGSTSTVMAGVDWAIQNHMDIINLSLSTTYSDLALKTILDKAYNAGILIVSAAGNGGTKAGTENTVEYPAKYASVIAVASLTEENKRLDSSATGEEVEIAAPGENVFSTIPKSLDEDGQLDGYTWMSGTSMATPFVVGILAQYKQQYPKKTNVELRSMLDSHALDIGKTGKDTWYGNGLVQATTYLDSPKMDVKVTASNGIVQLAFAPLSPGVVGYNVYRDGEKIASNQTDLAFHDYVLKGTYAYQFSMIKDGDESSLTSSTDVEVSSPYYKDLTNQSWYSSELIYLSNKSILTGFNDNTIRPNQYVTRAEAVSMMGRAVKLDGTIRKTAFTDVNAGSFASGYIQSAYEDGILHGFSDGSFHPNQPVTRAEMAILLAKAYHLTNENKINFTDVNEHVTGHEEINAVASAKITEGFTDGTFKPYNDMKRSDFGVFIARAENEEFR